MLKTKILIIIAVILSAIFSCINPIYPKDQFLQHIGTVLLLLILVLDLKPNKLSYLSFVSMSVFIILHIIGTRFIYSTVPYYEWMEWLLGADLAEIFNSQRNHYDRFVHLMFGILVFPYLFEVFDKKNLLKKSTKVFAIWCVIQAFSMFYELFEWLLTIVLSEGAANNYNGQQGDIWDAQKDMALAALGSAVVGLIYLFLRKKHQQQ